MLAEVPGFSRTVDDVATELCLLGGGLDLDFGSGVEAPDGGTRLSTCLLPGVVTLTACEGIGG